jgi:MoaA/NifB/PqqE/SkfB family radical SAM enzyme
MKKVNTLTMLKEFYPYIKGTSFRLKLFSLSKTTNERPHWFNNKIRINSFFPPYPSQSFDRIVDIIKNQKRIPHTIDFAVTSKCPYHCPHCSYGKRKIEDLSTNEILKLIEEIKDLGTAILGITGGEPMTRLDLEKIVSACSPELSTILYTTGFNFNKKRAKELYDANIGSIFIGIDSVDTKIQDKVRGKKGSLELGIKALEICNETGIYTGINTIATRERINNGELERIYDLACSLDVGELGINFPIATGRWAGCTNNQLKVEELELLKGIRKSLNKKRTGPLVTTPAEYESKDFMGCITGYQCLFIDASGEICPCDFTPLSFGNIKEKPLKVIWKEMEIYFSRPRADCLMRRIARNIDSDFFPLPPSDSKKMIPKLDKESPYPKIYKYTKKINK